jgi:hypothetical protein
MGYQPGPRLVTTDNALDAPFFEHMFSDTLANPMQSTAASMAGASSTIEEDPHPDILDTNIKHFTNSIGINAYILTRRSQVEDDHNKRAIAGQIFAGLDIEWPEKSGGTGYNIHDPRCKTAVLILSTRIAADAIENALFYLYELADLPANLAALLKARNWCDLDDFTPCEPVTQLDTRGDIATQVFRWQKRLRRREQVAA